MSCELSGFKQFLKTVASPPPQPVSRGEMKNWKLEGMSSEKGLNSLGLSQVSVKSKKSKSREVKKSRRMKVMLVSDLVFIRAKVIDIEPENGCDADPAGGDSRGEHHLYGGEAHNAVEVGHGDQVILA